MLKEILNISTEELLNLNEAFDANHQVIIQTVVNKRVVSFFYKGDKENAPGWRTVEPVCYGSRNGIKYIRAWQQKGKTTTKQPAWKFFRVDRIRNWNLASNQNRDEARPNFNPNGDKLLDNIFAISDYTKPLPPTPSPIKKGPKGGGPKSNSSSTKPDNKKVINRTPSSTTSSKPVPKMPSSLVKSNSPQQKNINAIKNIKSLRESFFYNLNIL